MADVQSETTKISLYPYIVQIAKKHAAHTDNGPWLTDMSTGKQFFSSDLEESSKKVANFLNKHGFRSQDIVLYNTNRLETLTMILGIWRLNGVTRACYQGESAENVAEMIRECKIRFAICDRKTAATVLDASKRVEWSVHVVCVDPFDGCTHFDDVMKEDGRQAPEETSVDVENDLCAIFTTGGTTGKSKGAMWTHSRFVGALAVSQWTLPVPANRSFVGTSTFTHIGGVTFALYSLRNGNHFVMSSDSTTEDLIEGIRKYKASAVTGFPPAIAAIASHPSSKSEYFNSVVAMSTFGSAIADAHKKALRGIMKNLTALHNLYGSTETCCISSTIDISVLGGEHFPAYSGMGEGCVGRPLPIFKVKIIDPDTGESVMSNRQGEILLKTPYIMNGYYNNMKESEASFSDGWYRTGDLGYLDQSGFLYYVSRIKDTFKYLGKHISSSRLEEIILQIPDAINACVIGIAHPELLTTEIPRAFVVKTEGSQLSAQDVMDYVKARVPDYQQLRGGVAFVNDLPQTRAGKVSRVQIRQMHINGEI